MTYLYPRICLVITTPVDLYVLEGTADGISPELLEECLIHLVRAIRQRVRHGIYLKVGVICKLVEIARNTEAVDLCRFRHVSRRIVQSTEARGGDRRRAARGDGGETCRSDQFRSSLNIVVNRLDVRLQEARLAQAAHRAEVGSGRDDSDMRMQHAGKAIRRRANNVLGRVLVLVDIVGSI